MKKLLQLVLVGIVLGVKAESSQKNILNNNEIISDIGAYCDKHRPCDTNKFLECIDNSCFCENPLHRAFANQTKACVNLAGSRCDPNSGPQCVVNSECKLARCRCNSGFSATSNKICLLDFLKPCEAHKCNGDKGLACKKNVCRCFDSSFVYNPLNQSCVNPEVILRNVFGSMARNTVPYPIRSTVNMGLDVAKAIMTKLSSTTSRFV